MDYYSLFNNDLTFYFYRDIIQKHEKGINYYSFHDNIGRGVLHICIRYDIMYIVYK